MQNNFFKIILFSSGLMFINILQAATEPPPPPPQEALAACSGFNEGSQCSFTHPQGTLDGFCISLGAELACAPEDAPILEGDSPVDRAEPSNLIAHYDATESILYLPVVSIADTLYYQLSLQLFSNEPTLLNLTDIIEVEKSDQVSATYDEMTAILLIPQMLFDNKRYSLSLKLIRSTPEYQFELISLTELIPPSLGMGTE